MTAVLGPFDHHLNNENDGQDKKTTAQILGADSQGIQQVLGNVDWLNDSPDANIESRPLSRFVGEQQELPFQDMLSYALSRRITGALTLYPLQITLHLHDGQLTAVEGGKPLGQVLVDQEVVSLQDLNRAMQTKGLIGQTLLRLRLVNPMQLRAGLRAQAREVLASLLSVPPESYELRETGVQLPKPHAGIPAAELLRATLLSDENLPLSSVFQLAEMTGPVTVESDAWQLLRWINGRRSLSRVLQSSGLEGERATLAAKYLISEGLIEQSNVLGLRLIVPQKRAMSEAQPPPASLKSNLFLKHIDGEIDVWSIKNKMRLASDETVSTLTSLYRDGIIEIKRGAREFQRLLEEY